MIRGFHEFGNSHIHHLLGHAVVLTTKEATARLDGLPSKLVRLGHLHEHANTVASSNANVEYLVTHVFMFDPVSEIPAEFGPWTSEANHILIHSSVCIVFAEYLFAVILAIGNWPWSSHRLGTSFADLRIALHNAAATMILH